MAEENIDIVARYGTSRGWQLFTRSVLVEGTSDVLLMKMAADLFRMETGRCLLGDLAIVAAGEGDRGGARGVIRELITLRSLAAALLSPAGKPVYRVIALFDDDTAGRNAVRGARDIDASITEYRDVFRLRPAMPTGGSLDPAALKRAFEAHNQIYKGLTWELEDLVGGPLMALFLEEYPTALIREHAVGNAIHRELTRDGKSQLVRFCRQHADQASLQGVIGTLHALRYYLSLPALK